MALAIDGGLVAGLLEELREGLLVPVEGVAVVHEPVLVAVLARLDDGPAGSAYGVRAETVLKEHALGGELVYVGRGVDGLEPTVVGPDGVRRVVVREDEQNVRAFFLG